MGKPDFGIFNVCLYSIMSSKYIVILWNDCDENKKPLSPERDKGENLCGTTLFALRPLKLAL
jgi:hypothetical protein